MTADYNGWNDAPEAEREALDLYSHDEAERETLPLERPQVVSLQAWRSGRAMRSSDLRPAA
jgi:hypothetical protein